MLGKFVYDTFLTDRTKQDWNDYKLNHPDEAERIENNSGLNFESKLVLRKDGVYIYHWASKSIYGEPVKLTIFLAFNKHKRAYFGEAEGFIEIDKDGLNDFLFDIENEMELSNSISEYHLIDRQVTMRFGINPNDWNEFIATIIDNGLLVTWYYHGYDMSAELNFKKL